VDAIALGSETANEISKLEHPRPRDLRGLGAAVISIHSDVTRSRRPCVHVDAIALGSEPRRRSRRWSTRDSATFVASVISIHSDVTRSRRPRVHVDATVWISETETKISKLEHPRRRASCGVCARRDLATSRSSRASARRSSASTATSRGLLGAASTWTHGLVTEIERNVSKRAASARGR
jgi:hypothetical protein